MSRVQKPTRSLLLGLLALGTGALGQNFLTSRPFLSDAVFVFGLGALLLVAAFPKGGLVGDRVAPILKRLSPSGQSQAIGFVAFSIGMFLYALTTLKGNMMPLHGWFAYLGGILLLVLGARSWDSSRGLPPAATRPPRWEVAAIVLITLVAAFIRFPDLNSLPYGVWYDEAVGGLDAVDVAAGMGFPVYYETESGHAVLSVYTTAVFFKFLGVSPLALRLSAAVAGVLLVPVFYKTIRQFFGVHPALVGAFLLAVSRWHFNFSRVAFDAVFVPLFACVSIYFLAKGFRTKKTTDFAIAGLAIAFGLNTYVAFRLFPAVIVLYLAHKFIFEFRSYRSVFPGLVAFGLAAFLAASPLLKYAYDNQKAFTARANTASVFTGKTPEQGQAALRVNIQKHLLMFNVRGDGNGRHNIPGEPMLDPISGLLFVLGAFYSLWNWRRSAHFVFIATFLVMILGGVLSLDFEAPQGLRSFGVIPAVFAFASLPLGLVWQTLDRFRIPISSFRRAGLSPATGEAELAAVASRSGADPVATDGDGRPFNPSETTSRDVPWYRRNVAEIVSPFLGGRPKWIVPGVLGILFALGWAGNTNYYNYFSRQVADFAVWNGFSTAETYIGYRLRELNSEDYDIFASPVYSGALPTIRFLAPDGPKHRLFDIANGIPLRTQKKWVVIFLETQFLTLYNQLRQYYPGGSFEPLIHKPYGGPPAMYEVRISRDDITRIQGLSGEIYQGDSKEGQPAAKSKAERLEFDWSKDRAVPAPFIGEWRGTIVVPQYGDYQFTIEGTASAALSLDESPLIDTESNPKTQATLAKGNHSIRLMASVQRGDENLRVKWQVPGGQLGVLSSDFVYTPPVTNNGLLGKYYRSPNWQGQPAFTQIDPSIAFYFHLIPLPRPYSVEWTGKVYAPVAGRYTFGTENISASQLFINQQRIVDNPASNQYREGQVNLQAGLHDITLRFQDRDGYSHIYLYWTPPGKGRELVPSAYLFPPQGSYPPPSAIPTPVPQQQPQTEAPKPVATPTVGPAPQIQSKREQPLLEFGRQGSGDGEFKEPRDLVVDRDGNIYVADTGNSRIQKFSPEGKFLAKWGKRGNGDGEFQEPLAIVIDSRNQLLVLDSTTSWIQRFDTNGSFKGKFAGPQAQFYHPRGMGIDSQDNVYVADTGGSRIVIFRASGEPAGTFGGKGAGDGQMLEPADVMLLEDGSILVSDVGNSRIQKFDSERRYIAQWKVPGAVAMNGGHLAPSTDGFLFVTEPERHRVVKYDSQMNALQAIGESGEGPGQFRLPVGLYVDPNGSLFVTDTYNHRIQKFPTRP